MKITREFYTSGYELMTVSQLAELYIKVIEGSEKVRAMAFTGKQAKPTWHYIFSSEEAAKEKFVELLGRLMKWEEMKQERKEEKKKEIAEVKVGEILYSSWGYDQTNVDFYQVVEVKGKTFKIRAIESKTVEGSTQSHGMADHVLPVRDAFLKDEEPIVKRSFKLNSYSWLSKTDDKTPHYRSWYA